MNKIHTLESKFNPKDFEDKIYKKAEYDPKSLL